MTLLATDVVWVAKANVALRSIGTVCKLDRVSIGDIDHCLQQVWNKTFLHCLTTYIPSFPNEWLIFF